VTSPARIGVAVIGTGYWGPHLLRNLGTSDAFDLRWACDLDADRARTLVGRYSTIRVTDDLADVLDDDAVHAVAVATPASSHLEIALEALDAGRHVLVEKPLAASVAEGQKLVDVADERGLVLMCDHTYCYTPAVKHLRQVVADGTIGAVEYVDSVRINLGLVRPDIDVIWDLAPHDLSILDFVLPEDQRPTAVAALGADPVGAGHACIAYLTLRLPGDAIAHLHLNWLSPTKVRTTIIGGSRRVMVWDDLHPMQRLSMYDRTVTSVDAPREEQDRLRFSYRVGDMRAPALPENEALGAVVEEFARAINEQSAPLTDGRAGVRVLEVLEAAHRSLRRDGVMVGVTLPALDGGRP
jgi:predicted dehydrogenase